MVSAMKYVVTGGIFIIAVVAMFGMTGCASAPEFRGGATSDYRPATGAYVVNSACSAVRLRMVGDYVYLEC